MTGQPVQRLFCCNFAPLWRRPVPQPLHPLRNRPLIFVARFVHRLHFRPVFWQPVLAQLELSLQLVDRNRESDNCLHQAGAQAWLQRVESGVVCRLVVADQFLQDGELAVTTLVDRGLAAGMDCDVVPGWHPVRFCVQGRGDVCVRSVENQQCRWAFLQTAPMRVGARHVAADVDRAIDLARQYRHVGGELSAIDHRYQGCEIMLLHECQQQCRVVLFKMLWQVHGASFFRHAAILNVGQ